MQDAVEAQEGHQLPGTELRFEIPVFVEQGFFGVPDLSQHRPVDLPGPQRLGIKVAARGQGGAFQLTDRHAILVQYAQLDFIDDRTFRITRGVHGKTEIAAIGRAPVEAVVIAVAGGDLADVAVVFPVVRKIDPENGAVGLPPLDQHTERRTHVAEIDRDALSGKQFDRAAAEGREHAFLAHRQRVGGRVEIELDDFANGVGRRIVFAPAHEPGRCRREREHILSALAVARAAEVGPGLAVDRGLEAVDAGELLTPIDFDAAEGGDRAEIDLEPRFGSRSGDPGGRIIVVDGRPGIATAAGDSPPILLWDLHGVLSAGLDWAQSLTPFQALGSTGGKRDFTARSPRPQKPRAQHRDQSIR